MLAPATYTCALDTMSAENIPSSLALGAPPQVFPQCAHFARKAWFGIHIVLTSHDELGPRAHNALISQEYSVLGSIMYSCRWSTLGLSTQHALISQEQLCICTQHALVSNETRKRDCFIAPKNYVAMPSILTLSCRSLVTCKL